jgi:hypothetical protein
MAFPCATKRNLKFGLIPAAQMTHNDVANTRYNNLDDDDCAA